MANSADNNVLAMVRNDARRVLSNMWARRFRETCHPRKWANEEVAKVKGASVATHRALFGSRFTHVLRRAKALPGPSREQLGNCCLAEARLLSKAGARCIVGKPSDVISFEIPKLPWVPDLGVLPEFQKHQVFKAKQVCEHKQEICHKTAHRRNKFRFLVSFRRQQVLCKHVPRDSIWRRCHAPRLSIRAIFSRKSRSRTHQHTAGPSFECPNESLPAPQAQSG